MILIRLENMKKVFHNGRKAKTIFQHVNLQFWYKGLYIIKGTSGSGKSTLLKLLAGLIYPTAGQYYYKGKQLAFHDRAMAKFRHQECGFIFQNYQLITGMNALENVAFPLIVEGISLREAEEKAKKLFSFFHLEDKLSASVNTLSGGEKQRIAIMRAMIMNPSFYLCDEPTGALDSKNAHFVMQMLKDIARDHLVIVVTHQQALAKKYGDKIFILKDGCFYEEK